MENDKLKYYDVRVESTVPAIVHYRILAKSPEHAESLVRYKNPNHIEYKFNKRKNLFMRIYDAGTLLMHIAKSLI